MTEKPLAFLSLIEVLEKAVGRSTGYALLEPFPCVTLRDYEPAIVSIQNAGRIIADHVGLSNLTFVIAVTLQDPSTAGHIELRYDSPEVFVEISRDICAYKDSVLATLCHEICHKFLHARGIRHGTVQVEQEFLTDVAAVYLGLGKIMLNGCECQSVRTEIVVGSKTTTTQTLRVGYISRECFAFVYRLVCQMRQIPSTQFLAGLSPPALQAVERCEQAYRSWFKPQYHTPNGIEELVNSLRRQVADVQACAAKRDRTLRHVVQTLQTMDGYVRDSHKLLFGTEARIAPLLEPNENPPLRYLNCVRTSESVADLTSAAKRKIAGHQPDWGRLDAVAKAMESSEDESGTSQIIECPLDKTKLRVPGGRKRLLVTCSLCKYKFIVSTAKEGKRGGSKSRLLDSIKRALRIR